MKLSVNLVTWNGEKYLPALLESLKNQTFKDFEFIVVDNGSVDKTVEVVKNFDCRLIENKNNVGFAAGHNQAYHVGNSEYFLIINQDIYLETDCLGKLVGFLDNHPDVGVVGPRVMKWDFEHTPSPSPEGISGNIDSLGLKVFRNRRVVEIGEGEEWRAPLFLSTAVFGVSGAIAMFRRSAVDVLDEFLDESFGSYKEDVDLAYRLNSVGFPAHIIYDAVAYHDRTGGGTKHKDDLSSAKNKTAQSDRVRYYSYRNHLITLLKNEYWQNCTLDFIWILWYELKKFVYFLLFDRRVLKGLGEIWKMRRIIAQKRKQIKASRKFSWKEIRGRF